MTTQNSTHWSYARSWNENWNSVRNLKGGGQGACKLVRGKIICADEPFFLKILNKQKDHDRRSRFFREASAYEQFSHPNLPCLVESNSHFHKDTSYNLYIVTEYIHGPNLLQHIQSVGPIALEEAIKLTRQILSVATHFHESDWVHRDIKPDNIILRNEKIDDPVLVDFGLSYSSEKIDYSTELEEEIGNRFLRLPELSSESSVKRDVRSDLSFIGGIMLFVLTGKRPSIMLDADSKMPHQRVDALDALKAASDSRCWDLLQFFDRTFRIKIEDRFKSAQEMSEALDKIERAAVTLPTMSVHDLENKLKERMYTQRNTELGLIRSSTNSALKKISDIHKEVINSTEGTYLYCQANQITSNTGISTKLGFSHFGDSSKKFMPTINVQVDGSELVVTFNDEQLLRTSAVEPTLDGSFGERIKRYYLEGLIRLSEDI